MKANQETQEIKGPFIGVILIGGPENGAWHARIAPPPGAPVEVVCLIGNESHKYSATYAGESILQLAYRGLVPHELCPIRRHLIGKG